MPFRNINIKDVEVLQAKADVLVMEVLKAAAVFPKQPTAVKVPFNAIAPAVVIPPVALIHGLAKLGLDELAIHKIDSFSFLQAMCYLCASLYHFDEKQIPEVYNTVIETDKVMPTFLMFAGTLRRVMETNGADKTQPEGYEALLKYIQRNTLPPDVLPKTV